MTFNTGGKSYDLTPNAQIWPRSLNTAIGGNSTAIYLIVNDIGAPSGEGNDFTLGYSFLYVFVSFVYCYSDHNFLYSPPFSQRYYSVYDTTNKRVGFASTANTNSKTN